MVHWCVPDNGPLTRWDPAQWIRVQCVYLLLLSSWARYFSQPFRRTRSPRRSRNSSNAGPELSLLYMSSSELCPARQYITPTFLWKFSFIIRQHREHSVYSTGIRQYMQNYTILSLSFCEIHLIWGLGSWITFVCCIMLHRPHYTQPSCSLLQADREFYLLNKPVLEELTFTTFTFIWCW